MRIVLQNKGSSAFVEDLHGGWTKDSQQALGFANGLEASLFCLNRRMKNMQMVATFLDCRMNFSVPVTDMRGD
jgi:hypothetical protein